VFLAAISEIGKRVSPIDISPPVVKALFEKLLAIWGIFIFLFTNTLKIIFTN